MKNSKKGRKLPVFFTEETYYYLMKNTNKMKHRVAFMLAFESGLRIAEVLALQKEDFNFKDNIIQIRQGKNSKDRVVMIPRDWKEHLMDFIPIDICARSLQEALYMAVKRAELDSRLHFHSLRHGYATHLIEEKGEPVKDVSQSMGHQDVSTTMIYTHINPKRSLNRMRGNF